MKIRLSLMPLAGAAYLFCLNAKEMLHAFLQNYDIFQDFDDGRLAQEISSLMI